MTEREYEHTVIVKFKSGINTPWSITSGDWIALARNGRMTWEYVNVKQITEPPKRGEIWQAYNVRREIKAYLPEDKIVVWAAGAAGAYSEFYVDTLDHFLKESTRVSAGSS